MQQFRVPDLQDRMPVVSTAAGVRRILETVPHEAAVLFFAHKGDVRKWDGSAARIAMNSIDPNLILIPVEVAPSGLADIYREALASPSVVGLNHTQPHKGNPDLHKMLDIEAGAHKVDFALRSGDHFIPVDVNGRAFFQWLLPLKPELRRASTVVVRGMGGAGSAIALEALKQGAFRVIAVEVDATRYREIAEVSHGQIDVHRSLDSVSINGRTSAVLVEATGSNDPEATRSLARFLERSGPATFVDLRLRHRDPKVALARGFGWYAYDGDGMAIQNDWQIATMSLAAVGLEPSINRNQFAVQFEAINDVLECEAITQRDNPYPDIQFEM